MAEFISTNAATLLSFICQNMPNLLRYIMLLSNGDNKRSTKLSMILLTPQQILQVKSSPTTSINEAFAAIASIQNAMNLTTEQLDNIIAERAKIEHAIAALLNKSEDNA